MDGEAFLILTEEEIKELVPSIGERRKLIQRQKIMKVSIFKKWRASCIIIIYANDLILSS